MEGGDRRTSIPHVAALDGARGAAVAGVLFFHGGHLVGGYLGVDFFFTLSGFLITSLLLAEATRTGTVGLGGFWARRARRLLPALAVLMVGVAVYALTLAKSTELTQIRGDALATLAYGANWRAVYSQVDYWALFQAPSPLNHTWSLAIEEQFYLIWPLMFVGLASRFKRATAQAVLATALALAAVSTVLMFVLYDPANTSRAYFGTDTRAAAILFGAALAAWLSMRGPVRQRASRIALEAAGIAAAIGLAIAWTHLDGQSSSAYRGGFLLCGVAATFVIAAIAHPQSGPLARLLSFGPLRALGLISYGVYLYHWPIDVVLDAQRVHLDGWPLFVVQTACTLAVATASFVLVEQPIRRGAVSSLQLRRLTPVVAVALVAALVFVTSGARSPAPAAEARTNKLEVFAARTLRRQAPPNALRVMVFGDSVGDVMAVSLRRLHAQPPIVVFDNAQGGCAFPPGITELRYDGANGVEATRKVVPCSHSWDDQTIQAFRPDISLWILSNPEDAMLYHGHWIHACAQPYQSLYERGLRAEIAKLGAGGARVVLTTAAYLGVTKQDPNTDCDNRLRRKVAAQTHTDLIDLFEHVCPKHHCRAKQDGAVLRPDGLHYFGRGGTIIAQWLVDEITALTPRATTNG